MKNGLLKVTAILAALSTTSCENLDDFLGGGQTADKKLIYIDEFVIPDAQDFEGTVFGGISGIDYADGTWYMISDDPNSPRFYTADIDFDTDGFNFLDLQTVVLFKNDRIEPLNDGLNDPEAIRLDGNRIVWTSEGNINTNLPPSVNYATLEGVFSGAAILPEKYEPSGTETEGPRQNGVFEGISLSIDGNGYWVNMELPLIQDGPAPGLEDTDSPVRFAYIDKNSGEFGKEFAYELDPVVRPGGFQVNGVVELLEYSTNQFLVIERSFSTGYDDGGNNVKIYDVDASEATDVSEIETLAGADYDLAKKTLLFDFEAIRNQLTDGIVDNIEGIVFGPDFANGNKSVILVADNNFSAFGPQLNQFVLFELED